MSKLRNTNQEGAARTVAPLGLGEEEVCDGAGQEGRGEAGGGQQQQSEVEHGHSWSVVSVTAYTVMRGVTRNMGPHRDSAPSPSSQL